jgi:hypothetical protein
MDMLGRRDFLWKSALTAASIAVAGVPGVADARRRSTVALGVWPGPYRNASAADRRRRQEGAIGRRFIVDRARGDAYALDKPIVPSYIRESVQQGRRAYLKLQSWVGDPPHRRAVPWSDVASGRWDREIASRARSAARLRGHHFIAFHAEANVQSSSQPTSGTPAEFARAFDHTRRIFEQQGAHGLIWVVVLTASAYRVGYARQWMPDGFDLIGVDGYNSVATSPDKKKSFKRLFAPAAHFAHARRCDLFIGEMGCEEARDDRGYKAHWISRVPAALRDFGNVRAVVWNHSDDTHGGWRLDTSGQALHAFRQVANAAPFE